LGIVYASLSVCVTDSIGIRATDATGKTLDL